MNTGKKYEKREERYFYNPSNCGKRPTRKQVKCFSVEKFIAYQD
jgi:hypothetical protein